MQINKQNQIRRIKIDTSSPEHNYAAQSARFWRQHGFQRFPLREKGDTKAPRKGISNYHQIDTHSEFSDNDFACCGIGLLFQGSGFIGLDIDPKIPDGRNKHQWIQSGDAHRQAEAIIDAFPQLFTDSEPCQLTGKGFHFIKYCPEAESLIEQGKTCIQHPLGKIEVYVKSNSYFCVSPTQHPDNPYAYRWVNGGETQAIAWNDIDNIIKGKITTVPQRRGEPLTPSPRSDETAMDYAKRAPKSIDGHEGGGTTLGVLRRLRSIAKSDTEFDDAADYYNKNKCQPMWNGKEWNHKLDESAKGISAQRPASHVPNQELPDSRKVILRLLESAGAEIKRDITSHTFLLRFQPESPIASYGFKSEQAGFWLPLTEIATTRIQTWAAENFKIIKGTDEDGKTKFAKWALGFNTFQRAIQAHNNGDFNPKEDWFKQCENNLPQDTEWHNYLEDIWEEIVEATAKQINDDTQTAQEIVDWGARTLILGQVARSCQIGYKLDESVVLVGGQGMGKRTLMEHITPTLKEMGIWSDNPAHRPYAEIDDMSADAKVLGEIERGMMVVAMPEMAGMDKADLAKLKAHQTATMLNYRPAYARETLTQWRSCVMVGKTNDIDNAIPSDNENRRWVPISVGGSSNDPVEILTAQKRQLLFGLAYRDWKAGESPNFPTNLKPALAKLTDTHSIGLPFIDDIEEAVKFVFDANVEFASTSTILSQVTANGGPRNISPRHLAKAMRQLGFERIRMRVGGNDKQRGWVRVRVPAK